MPVLEAPEDIEIGDVTASSIEITWQRVLGAVRYEISHNSAWVDAGTSHSYIFQGLISDTQYVFKVRAVDAEGNAEESDPIAQSTLPLSAPIAIRIDCGRRNSTVTNGWSGATPYLVGPSDAPGTESSPVDVSAVTDPAPAVVYSTFDVYLAAGPPTYLIPISAGLVGGKNYRVRAHFNEYDPTYVGGTITSEVLINGKLAVPLGAKYPAAECFFDARIEAGAPHKAYIIDYIVPAAIDGTMTVVVRTAPNAPGARNAIYGLEILEAAPVADFSFSTPADQTGTVAFTDLSSGKPTSWSGTLEMGRVHLLSIRRTSMPARDRTRSH
jgi:hypothetical protein